MLIKCQVCFAVLANPSYHTIYGFGNSYHRSQRYYIPDNQDLPEYRFDCSKPWKETFLDMTNHYLLRINMVMNLPCMPPQKLLQIHLKGFVLRIGSLILKPFLTKVAMFKLLIMNLKYSDNNQKHAEVSSVSSPKEAESRSACWKIFVKSIIKPSINDWILIKNNSRDFQIGKIIMLIKIR